MSGSRSTMLSGGDLSGSGVLATSTPRPGSSKRRRTPSSVDLDASHSIQKNPSYRCDRPECNNTYKKRESLVEHIQGHIAHDVLSDELGGRELLAECMDRTLEYLREQCDSIPATPGQAAHVHLCQLVNAAKQEQPERCAIFLGRVGLYTCESLSLSYSTDPSEILTNTYVALQGEVSKREVAEMMQGLLNDCVSLPRHLTFEKVWAFLAELLMAVCDRTLSGLLKGFAKRLTEKSGSLNANKVAIESIDHLEASAEYFAYGGAVHFMGRPGSTQTDNVALLKHGADCVEPRRKGFTEAQNRGGLTFIGKDYSLFASGVLMIMKKEKDLRKLSYDFLIEQVDRSSPLNKLWYERIKGSKEFRDTCCKKLYNLIMKGKINLVHNSSEKGPKTSQTLRATVAVLSSKAT